MGTIQFDDDYQSLKYIITQKYLNNRERRRWLDFLIDYDINIDYQEGTSNKVADRLGHQPKQLRGRDIVAMITRLAITPNVISSVRMSQKEMCYLINGSPCGFIQDFLLVVMDCSS